MFNYIDYCSSKFNLVVKRIFLSEKFKSQLFKIIYFLSICNKNKLCLFQIPTTPSIKYRLMGEKKF